MSEDRDAILARRRRFIAVALTALGGTTQCRPETPQPQPLPEARVVPPATSAAWRSNDTDGDGVPEPDDACPDVAEDADKIDDADGCPETDADKDTIADEVDYCPKEPGRDGSRLGRGCPCLNMILPSEVVITEVVRYGFGETKVPKEAAALLERIATTLRNDPRLKLAVEGYCESSEPKPTCEARAKKVVEALVAAGVEPARLAAKGMDGPPPTVGDVGRAAARIVKFVVE